MISGTAVEFDVAFGTEILPEDPAPEGAGYVSSYVKSLQLTIGGHSVGLEAPPPIPNDLSIPHPLGVANRRIRFSSLRCANGLITIQATGEALFVKLDNSTTIVPITASVQARVYNRSAVWMTSLVSRDVPGDDNIGLEWPDAAAAGAEDATTRFATINLPRVGQTAKLTRLEISGRDEGPFTGPDPVSPPLLTQSTVLFAFTHGHTYCLEDSGTQTNSQGDYVGRKLRYNNHIGYAIGLKSKQPPYLVPGSSQPFPPLTLAFHYACDTAGPNKNNWTNQYLMNGASNKAWVGFEAPVWSTMYAGNIEELVEIPKDQLFELGPKDLLSLHSMKTLELLCDTNPAVAHYKIDEAVFQSDLQFMPRTAAIVNDKIQFRALRMLINGEPQTTLYQVYRKNFSGAVTSSWWYLTSTPQ